MKKSLLVALALGLSGAMTLAPAALAQAARSQADMPAVAALSAEALREDLAAWEAWLFATHPDPGFSMDVPAVRARFAAVADSLAGHYTRREAWCAMAVLNPLFGDGHVTLRLPADDHAAWLAAGGPDFALPVRFASDALTVAETIAPASPLRAGDRLLAINDQPVEALVAAALARTHGDSEGLRRHLVASRFGQYLWALTGGAPHWRVTVERQGRPLTLNLDPTRDRADRAPVTSALTWQDGAAILTLNSFMPDQSPDYYTFIDDAFARIDESGADVLVIDISENGGGAHMLSDHLLAYLTDRRHTPLSAVTARITPENQALIPGSRLGDVVSMPFAQWVEPPADQPHRFTGRFAFLVGAGSYSQAIVLAATVQDLDIAPVAGPGTEGRANSTGQIQRLTLPNSTLEAVAPIYVFIRPSGDRSNAPIIPDIPLTGSREAQITSLIARLRNMPD